MDMAPIFGEDKIISTKDNLRREKGMVKVSLYGTMVVSIVDNLLKENKMAMVFYIEDRTRLNTKAGG